ncbi:MAG: LuxR C-terminal-related transcriptional regulator [Candidatus Dormibacteraeota bacterium]|nr:LuxR C-terminal-related transcriptional regulator [Candidatus Dormibacteraeota bacterium]
MPSLGERFLTGSHPRRDGSVRASRYRPATRSAVSRDFQGGYRPLVSTTTGSAPGVGQRRVGDRPGGFSDRLLDARRLTILERQVLLAYSEGFSRCQIAARVHKSPRRVTHCLTVAKEKLGAASLAQAAVMLAATPPSP